MESISLIRNRWSAARKLYGHDNEIITPDGRKVLGRYVIVESGMATPSHDPMNGFQKSAGFPTDTHGHTVNDRDYERDRDAQAATRDIARSYDSRALQSPVIVSRDGVILSGNGRTMAGMIAAEDNTDTAYVGHLAKFSSMYGFTAEDIAAFTHPRLLLEVYDDFHYTSETFAAFNAQEMKSQSKTEQAVKLGKLVDDETFHRIVLSINTFDTLCDFYNNTRAATEAINDLRSAGVISQMQYPEMFDGDAISQHARELLENVLIGKAFQRNPDAVREITTFRAIRKNIITALAEISNNIALSDSYSLEAETAQAIALVYQARQCGYKEGDRVSAFARQTSLFDDGSAVSCEPVATAVLMLSDLINSAQVARLKRAFTLYNREAGEASAGQYDIFSGKVRTKEDILRQVIDIVCESNTDELRQALREATTQRKETAQAETDKRDLEGESGRILQVLRSFNIKVEGIKATTGATVTLYQVTPSVGVRVSKVRNLKDELAIALSVPSVRIIAPMDNGTIGIEVPNRERAIVPVSGIFAERQFVNADMDLPLCIGRKVDNEVFIADLAEMPHLLVAGATGQGKSVCLNVLILSLLQKKSPDELKFILIDPKQVELSVYSRIKESYLACPIVTNAEEAEMRLDSLCRLMDERYQLLASAGARNIAEYNRLCSRRLIEGEKLPYVVTIIDEYGDLILTAGREMERTICRIAQKARAVGIHMIIATQRPDTKIVTGNIKANFPTRIAFRTTTGVDSRVVIDQMGAEKLTGRGDMIFFDSNGTTRVQCAYASIEDVLEACEEIRNKYPTYGNTPIIEEPKSELSAPVPRLSESLHPMAKTAAMLVAEQREVSESWVRVYVHLSFMDARKVFNQLQQLGIVETNTNPCRQSVQRRVLINDKAYINRLIESHTGTSE